MKCLTKTISCRLLALAIFNCIFWVIRISHLLCDCRWHWVQNWEIDKALWHLSPAQTCFCPDYNSKSPTAEIKRMCKRNSTNTRAHTAWQAWVHPSPLGPFVLHLLGCPSVSPALTRCLEYTLIYEHTHTCSKNCCVIFFPAVARCLSSHDSSMQLRPTESIVHCNLQVKCAWLSHLRAMMITFPRKAIECDSSYSASFTTRSTDI